MTLTFARTLVVNQRKEEGLVFYDRPPIRRRIGCGCSNPGFDLADLKVCLELKAELEFV